MLRLACFLVGIEKIKVWEVRVLIRKIGLEKNSGRTTKKWIRKIGLEIRKNSGKRTENCRRRGEGEMKQLRGIFALCDVGFVR